ncbi:MAG: hypothetical protein ACXWYN_07270 [Actinomycetota bacterium]
MTAIRPRPWRHVAGIGACLVLAWFSVLRDVRVPLLGLVDLGFHELGHLLMYPLPDVVTAAMGSIVQVFVPLALVAYFTVLHRDALAAALCLAWAGTSARDAAVYIADAPFERLELIGGDHDWAFVLGPGHLDALDAAGTIASVVRVGGTLLIVAGLVVCLRGLAGMLPERTQRPVRPPEPDLGFGGRARL